MCEKAKRFNEIGPELYAESLAFWSEKDYRIFMKLPGKTKFIEQGQKYLKNGENEKVIEILNDMQTQFNQTAKELADSKVSKNSIEIQLAEVQTKNKDKMKLHNV